LRRPLHKDGVEPVGTAEQFNSSCRVVEERDTLLKTSASVKKIPVFIVYQNIIIYIYTPVTDRKQVNVRPHFKPSVKPEAGKNKGIKR
jgi:hypothetical protein